MAAKEPYDYLSAIAADVDYTLSVSPDNVLFEEGEFSQAVHVGDDGSEERISFSTAAIFFFLLQWEAISESDAGAIMEAFFDSSKGAGITKTFKFVHPDTHTYVVRFTDKLRRGVHTPTYHSVDQLRLRVLGYLAPPP